MLSMNIILFLQNTFIRTSTPTSPNMENIIAECKTIWTEAQEDSGNKRSRSDSSSEDRAEEEPPAKRIRLQAKAGID